MLDLDQRCLGGLWTSSGYQRELDSPHSDLLVLLSADSPALLQHRQHPFLSASPSPASPSLPFSLIGVGCLWAILEEAHIITLAIDPDHQGQKLGQLLLSQLLLCGYKRGLTRATLEVRASNQPALNLYQKFAFKAAGIRKRYYSDGENACILWRSGLQSEAVVRQVTQWQAEAIAQLNAHQIQIMPLLPFSAHTDIPVN